MQYVAIKQVEKDGKTVFTVPAIPLKNKNKSVVQKIPHPMGTDSLSYKTVEEAKEAISRAGFSFILPNGEKEVFSKPIKKIATEKNNYEDLIYSTLKKKINSPNSNVSAAAILAISEFPTEETFKILFDKIGEDNDIIRKNAISGICRHGKILQDKIIEGLNSSNWVTRNSLITCIINLIDDKGTDLEKFINPLIGLCDDVNPVVQTSAISALAVVYQNYLKNKKV